MPNELHEAASEGDITTLFSLLDPGDADVNLPHTKTGRTPLSYAVASGKVITAKILLEDYSARIDILGRDGLSLLHYAIWSGCPETLCYIKTKLSYADASTPTSGENKDLSCVWLLATYSMWDEIQECIEHYPNLDYDVYPRKPPSRHLPCPPIVLIYEAGQYNLVAAFIEKDIQVNFNVLAPTIKIQRRDNGEKEVILNNADVPLSWAIASDRKWDLMSALIKKNKISDYNVVPQSSEFSEQTLFWKLVCHEQFELCREIIARGHKINFKACGKDKNGTLSIANILAAENQYGIVTNANLDPEDVPEYLLIAAKAGLSRPVEKWMTQGVSININLRSMLTVIQPDFREKSKDNASGKRKSVSATKACAKTTCT